MTSNDKETIMAAASEPTAAETQSAELPAADASETKKRFKSILKKNIDPTAPLTVSSSPHIKTADTTRSIMIDVLIALFPSFVWGVCIFGTRALSICVISVICAVGFEALYELILRKPVTVVDGSAAVTGLLLGMNLPATVPLWIPIVGAFFAIVIVKQLYGGIGKNFMNPALAARAFLMLAWPAELTAVPSPFTSSAALSLSVDSADIIASATPMQLLKNGEIPDTGLFNLLLGSKPGTIGEISTLLLIAGGLYLLVRRVITWHIPVAYIGTVAVIAYLFPQCAVMYRTEFIICEVICGGLMLGAIYMATDYATSPVTANGRLLYGVGCGAITMFIRYFGGYNEGVTFAILIMNTLVWYIDLATRPKRFGGVPSNGK